MQSSFKRNLLVGYGVSIFLLLVSSVASYVSIDNLLSSSERVNQTHQVIIELENVLAGLKDAETSQRGFLLTTEDEFMTNYASGGREAQAAVERVRERTLDNPQQTALADSLKILVNRRLYHLEDNVQRKKSGITVSTIDLEPGLRVMQATRRLVNVMKDREEALLIERTASQNRFSNSTPVLIVVAAALGIIITVLSFLRVNADFERKAALQKELEKKDEEVQHRIALIQGIAEQVSGGNYSVRVSDEGKDVLGSLANSLNKMAESLDKSFNELSRKEWLQTGVAKVNEGMLGEKPAPVLAQVVLDELIDYTGSVSGAFYLSNEVGLLRLAAVHAIDSAKKEWKPGEGLVGEAAKSGRVMEIANVQEADYAISFAAGAVKPRNIIAIPVMHNRKLRGVIELASMETFDDRHRELFAGVSDHVGITINLAQNRERVQELLTETQSQSEELQAQHTELENINTELEAQTQKLQTSEEELKVQQEELLQANQEMEERARLLEEKNQLIAERNLEIQQKAEALELSTRYKSEFLANMSHELRTPLNSVLLLSRLLGDNPAKNLTEEQVEYARVIQTSGQGLLTLIDEILDLSKIEAGKMELSYEMVSVQEMMDGWQSLFEPFAREKKLQLNTNIQPGISSIETDRLRLDQIIKNLLSNALKFTQKGEVSLQVKHSADNKQVLFVVTDTGIGIAEDKRDQIFEAFQQADGSTRRNFGGTGLGLSISRQLAKLLGGNVTVTSETGKGSAFTLTLPAWRKQAAKETPAAAPVATPVAEKQTVPLPTVSTKIPDNIPDDREKINAGDRTILIVEDDTNFAKTLLDFTHKKGYKGIVAVRGDEGIELAKKFRPAGILLDIYLPVKDGWQVMDELKSDPQTRHIPVHIMSSVEARKESLMKGAVDFINKPVAIQNMQEIFRKIEMVLNKKSKKVLIVEENRQHAKALSFFLENFHVNAHISPDIPDSIQQLQRRDVDCVILDMGIPAQNAYDMLEKVKETAGLENLPIIIFTGRNLSKTEEARIKQYADSIVVKTAYSYQRIIDEVSIFLHLVEENGNTREKLVPKRMHSLKEVLEGKKVLIADDDVRNIFSITKTLELHGMEVISAIDGKDAIRQMEANEDVSVVLMDIMMPEMDGYETIRQLRRSPKYKRLPIIAITAKAMTGDREKCIEAGASDYISKPIDVDQLLSLLRVWLYDSGKARS
jgi:signal transduction histidine kinase/DNA-binding response OmpR family regulator/CHASE3 domain sensor protein